MVVWWQWSPMWPSNHFHVVLLSQKPMPQRSPTHTGTLIPSHVPELLTVVQSFPSKHPPLLAAYTISSTSPALWRVACFLLTDFRTDFWPRQISKYIWYPVGRTILSPTKFGLQPSGIWGGGSPFKSVHAWVFSLSSEVPNTMSSHQVPPA